MGIWIAWMMSLREYEILDLYSWDIRCLSLVAAFFYNSSQFMQTYNNAL